MKRYLPPLLCIAAAGCVSLGNLFRHPVPVGDDRSIVFPQFFEHAPVEASAPGQPFELDGVTLRAMTLAADDFLPSTGTETPCTERREAHVFRVIRRGDIVFVRIDEDPAYCGLKHGGLDSGARYAVSTDGKILRRVLDGMEEYAGPPEGSTPVPGTPGLSPSFDPEHLQPLPFMLDGGTSTDGGGPGR